MSILVLIQQAVEVNQYCIVSVCNVTSPASVKTSNSKYILNCKSKFLMLFVGNKYDYSKTEGFCQEWLGTLHRRGCIDDYVAPDS